MHRLLRRQLRRHLPEEMERSAELERLLQAVADAYAEADADRRLLERSLELTSTELLQRNRDLRADVEARRDAEEALRRREERTRAILAALPDLLLVVAPDDTLREVHAPRSSFLASSGAQPGQYLADAIPAEIRDELVATVTHARETRGSQRCELAVMHARERLRYEARLTVTTRGDVVIVMRDQTERVHMAERLRVADRMASVGTLAAGVAHELNNPLAYVLGNLEQLRQRLQHGAATSAGAASGVGVGDAAVAELRELVDEALDGARRMRAITQDLRTFSQPHAEVIASVDPRAVIDSALKIAGTEIRHRAVLRRDYAPIPAVLAEASKLGQVFLNLVVNAVQALPVGEVAQHEILVRTFTDDDGHAIVEVSDTGPGLPRHLESRIFEPFVTTKPREVGTGLGLSICHNIVTSLGGRITAHRRRPRGTTFRVRLPPSGLPVAPQRPSTGHLPAVRDDKPSATKRKVLIIDDDPLVGNSLRRMLSAREVEIADNGRKALEILREHDDYEVVLCDLMMPEVSGMDVYESVCDEQPDVARRFVFMTGGAFTQRARAFLDDVPNARLEKPFDGKTLRGLVADMMGDDVDR